MNRLERLLTAALDRRVRRGSGCGGGRAIAEDGLFRRHLAGASDQGQRRGAQDLSLCRRFTGGAGRRLRRRQPPPHHRGDRGAGAARGRRRHLVRRRVPGDRRLRSRGRGVAGPSHRGGGRDAGDRPQLLRADQLCRRRASVAGPAWRQAARRRRARGCHHHPVIQHRLQPDHAAARAADRLPVDGRQPGADRAVGDGARPRRGSPRFLSRPAYRGLRRPGRIRAAGGARPGARQADRRHEGRPVGAGAGGDDLAYGVAGRLRRGV